MKDLENLYAKQLEEQTGMLKKEKNRQITVNSNCVWLVGKIEGEMEYSHSAYSEKYYEVYVRVANTKIKTTKVRVVISEKNIHGFQANKPLNNKSIELQGTFRSFRKTENGIKKTIENFVYVDSYHIYENNSQISTKYTNQIMLKGVIALRKPYLKENCGGKNKTDFIIMVSRQLTDRKDFIPCIAWNENAIIAGKLEVGDCIEITGQIQNRVHFIKDQYDEHVGEYKEVKEVLVSSIEKS